MIDYPARLCRALFLSCLNDPGKGIPELGFSALRVSPSVQHHAYILSCVPKFIRQLILRYVIFVHQPDQITCPLFRQLFVHLDSFCC